MHPNFLNDSDFGNFNVKVLENSGSHWDNNLLIAFNAEQS